MLNIRAEDSGEQRAVLAAVFALNPKAAYGGSGGSRDIDAIIEDGDDYSSIKINGDEIEFDDDGNEGLEDVTLAALREATLNRTPFVDSEPVDLERNTDVYFHGQGWGIDGDEFRDLVRAYLGRWPEFAEELRRESG